jgi:hypothetical protein
MLAAITKNEIRATMKPAFGMATPSPVSTEEDERVRKIPLPETRSAFARIH